MDMVQFVPESLLILITVLVFLGAIIKQASFLKDEFIPFILIAVGIAFALLIEGVSAQSVLQGIICAACAVLGNNVVKQGMKLSSNEAGK